VTTGYVSPQFHILFDEEFNTVTVDNINVTDALWDSFNFTYTSYLPDDDDPLLVLQQETIPPPPFSPQGASQAPQGASQAPQGAGPTPQGAGLAPQGAGIPAIKKEEVIAPPLPEEDENNDGINDSDSDGNNDPPPAAPTARTQCRNRSFNPKFHGDEWVNVAIHSVRNAICHRPIMNSSDAFVASLNFASTPKSSQGKCTRTSPIKPPMLILDGLTTTFTLLHSQQNSTMLILSTTGKRWTVPIKP
jgi:hypothetical protein